MKDLGIANRWSAIVWTRADGSKFIEKEDTTPDEYTACHEAGHKTREAKIGSALYRVFCDKCEIYWDYDCSG